MAENKRYLLSDRAQATGRKFNWIPLAAISTALILAVAIFEQMAFIERWQSPKGLLPLLAIFVLAAFFSGIVDLGLSFTPVSEAWQYRGAVLAGLFMGVFTWILPLSGLSGTANSPAISALLAVLAGSVFGGVLVSWVKEGFYENNQPPSLQIRTEVLARHQDLIGHPQRGSLPKRIFDILLAGFGLLIAAPIWILIILLIWFEDPGPVIFIKNSVGKGGKNFHQFKFRTMISGAEMDTGPIPARESDSRVLVTGKLLRKTALDELPQLVNILLGEMSFVGPRPQRTVLVSIYLGDLPAYAERHRVLPGLAGLAQVAGDYYLTPLQKLRYDRLYARHASLSFDVKLLTLAFVLVFWLRWHREWDGKISRSWLR